MSTYYEVGDAVTYRRPDGADIRATVIARCDNLADGKPGLIGADREGRRTYAYDSEIVGVNPTVEQRRRKQIADLLIAARDLDRKGDTATAESFRREADRLIEQATAADI